MSHGFGTGTSLLELIVPNYPCVVWYVCMMFFADAQVSVWVGIHVSINRARTSLGSRRQVAHDHLVSRIGGFKPRAGVRGWLELRRARGHRSVLNNGHVSEQSLVGDRNPRKTTVINPEQEHLSPAATANIHGS